MLEQSFYQNRRAQMRRCLLVTSLLLVLGSWALADQVTLKNGDRFSGSIVSGDGKTLVMKTEFAGDVTIQWDAITGIESSGNLNLTLKDGKRLSGKITTTADGRFIVAGTPAAAPEAAPTKDAVVAVRDDAEQKAFDINADHLAHPKITYFWGGLFDTGLALTRGNSSTVTYTLAAKAIRETPRDKLTLYSNYIYGSDSSTSPTLTTANSLAAGARFDYNLTPRFFLFGIGDFQTNELQHLDLRAVFGGGAGYHIIKSERTTFDVFGGFTYERDNFGAYTLVDGTTIPPTITPIAATMSNSASVVVGEELDSHINKRTLFTERYSIYPNITNTGDFRSQFDLTIATKLKNWLSWQATFSDQYINFPPPGLKGNDILLSTGLRVTWGKAKM
jgi:putative salt-induced outer membrane protein